MEKGKGYTGSLAHLIGGRPRISQLKLLAENILRVKFVYRQKSI